MGSGISLWPKTNRLNTGLYPNLLIKAGTSKLHKTTLREAVHVVAVLTEHDHINRDGGEITVTCLMARAFCEVGKK